MSALIGVDGTERGDSSVLVGRGLPLSAVEASLTGGSDVERGTHGG